MRIYLVQHADAKSEKEDPERSLTEKGKKDIYKVANFICKKGVVKVSRIFHSGKTRARQTAEIISEFIKQENGIEQAEGLAPLDDPFIWKEKLKTIKEDIMIVGHLPHLSKLASLLIVGDENKKIIDFQTAGILCLKNDEANLWSVSWFIVPEMI